MTKQIAPSESEALKDYLTISGERVPIAVVELPQDELCFYPENPRVYSVVRNGQSEPTQAEIQEHLIGTEHVRELKEDIKRNGGLLEPVIVKDGTFEVLEGNCRLAAYRLLSDLDPIKWGRIKCVILPGTIGDDLIFALLGQYHIRGRKDWIPYEKAGFLNRRHVNQKISISMLSREIGESSAKIKHLIDTYSFMGKHKQVDPRLWSHYDEYLKSSKIRKIRKKYPNFDGIIVEKIESSEIANAVEIRDELPIICSGPAKNLKKFISGHTAFTDAVEVAADAGGDNAYLRRFSTFRSWLAKIELTKAFAKCEKESQGRLIFEIDKINARLTAIRKVLKP